MKHTICLFFCLLQGFVTIDGLQAQQSELKITLTDYLEVLETRFDTSFSYNSNLLKSFKISKQTSCKTLNECLDNLKGKIPFKFQQSDNAYLILPIRFNIEFKVVDTKTQESINDLRIQVNKEPVKSIYAESSVFNLDNIFELDSIYINASNYKELRIQGKDLKKLSKPLQLFYKEIDLKEVVITSYLTKGIDAKLNDHSFKISMKSLGILSGETDGDIFNLLKNIPGINAPDGKPGNLNFRGSPFDQNLIQIDGINIYNQGHFLGTVSPYNPLAVSDITVLRNSLPSNYGGRVGGLLKMETSNKVPDSTSYKVLANTLYSGVLIKTAIVKNKLGIIISARTNYPNLGAPKLEAFSELNFQGTGVGNIASDINTSDGNFNTNFYDFNAKLMYDINQNHKATFSFIAIQDDLSILQSDESKVLVFQQEYGLNNWGITGKIKSKIANNISSEINVSKSSFKLNSFENKFDDTNDRGQQDRTNIIEDFSLSAHLTNNFNKSLQLDAGYQLINHQLRFRDYFANTDDFINRDLSAIIHSFFINTQHTWNNNLIVNLGLHSDYYEPLQSFYIDPRISISYLLNHKFTLKASAGRSRQFIQQKLKTDFNDFRIDNQFWSLASDVTPVIFGNQAMIGATYSTSGWLFDVEFFIKKTNNITRQIDQNENEIGYLTSTGTDLFIKKRWSNFESWLGYSLSWSDTHFKTKEAALFDQRHIINLTSILHANKFNFSATWSLTSGLPVEIPNLENNNTNIDFLYNNRFPLQHQLDVSATYGFSNTAKTWNGIVGVSLVNIYDRENIVNIFQTGVNSNNLFRESVGFAPNLQVSFSF